MITSSFVDEVQFSLDVISKPEHTPVQAALRYALRIILMEKFLAKEVRSRDASLLLNDIETAKEELKALHRLQLLAVKWLLGLEIQDDVDDLSNLLTAKDLEGTARDKIIYIHCMLAIAIISGNIEAIKYWKARHLSLPVLTEHAVECIEILYFSECFLNGNTFPGKIEFQVLSCVYKMIREGMIGSVPLFLVLLKILDGNPSALIGGAKKLDAVFFREKARFEVSELLIEMLETDSGGRELAFELEILGEGKLQAIGLVLGDLFYSTCEILIELLSKEYSLKNISYSPTRQELEDFLSNKDANINFVVYIDDDIELDLEELDVYGLRIQQMLIWLKNLYGDRIQCGYRLVLNQLR